MRISLTRQRGLGAARLPHRLVFAGGALALGSWLGLDLRGDPRETASAIFTLFMVTSATLPLAALGHLYHDRLHLLTLPWPLDGRQHFAIGLRLFVTAEWPWLGVLLSACVSASIAHGWRHALVASAFALSAFLGAAATALGCACTCALLADANGALVTQLRASLAGPFASERHAPFFYLPALAFALSSFGAALSQEVALAPLLAAETPSMDAATLLWLASPLLVGLGVTAIGATGYGRHALRVIPRVHEEARMVYGGKPAPADAPYGLRLGALLPRDARAFFSKELREQGRAQRGLWAVISLGIVAALLYALGSGEPSRVAPLLGLVLVVWTSTLPARRARALLGHAFLRTLPRSGPSSWFGRWFALLFVGLHVAVPAALALALRGQARQAVALGGALVTCTIASVTVTQPERRALPGPLVPALSLLLGLAALLWFPHGLLALLALVVLALPGAAR